MAARRAGHRGVGASRGQVARWPGGPTPGPSLPGFRPRSWGRAGSEVSQETDHRPLLCSQSDGDTRAGKWIRGVVGFPGTLPLALLS